MNAASTTNPVGEFISTRCQAFKVFLYRGRQHTKKEKTCLSNLLQPSMTSSSTSESWASTWNLQKDQKEVKQLYTDILIFSLKNGKETT